MAAVKIVEGEIFRDARGRISSLNDFRFPGVERFYFIHHPDITIIRGWHGHRFEKKWFYCVKGAFTLGLVEIDDWETPSRELRPELYHLSEQKSEIICVPEGYANCIRAEQPDSVLLVFSGKILSEAQADSWRYPADYWFDWSAVK
ncbi:MAG: WxcM-like domain-containing protein [Victivallis sp.]|jgi:wxcM domain protein